MAKTNWQDPKTSEMRSTHISGLMEAVGKIEDSIGMETVTETNIPLTEVFISSDDRYRIFQAPEGKRNWTAEQPPVIKRNGAVISSGFEIDYGGGAIILNINDTVANTYTADVTYIKQTEISSLKTQRFVIGTSTAGWTEKDCDYLCDGTADQVEINNAITALPATGGEIVILDGTYNITAKIDVNKSNVSIRGNGNATVLKRMWDSIVMEGVITLLNVTGCKVADLQVDGNKTVYTSSNYHGIYLYLSSNNTITGNTCNNNDCGIYLDSSSNNTVTGNTCMRGTGLTTDYTSSQYTIRLSGTGSNYNLISSNMCMGKAVVVAGGTGNTLVNNKWDASDDIQNIEEQINTLDAEVDNRIKKDGDRVLGIYQINYRKISVMNNYISFSTAITGMKIKTKLPKSYNVDMVLYIKGRQQLVGLIDMTVSLRVSGGDIANYFYSSNTPFSREIKVAFEDDLLVLRFADEWRYSIFYLDVMSNTAGATMYSYLADWNVVAEDIKEVATNIKTIPSL